MITESKRPIWFDYIELDDDFNEKLRDDAPQDVKEAYEQHLKSVDAMSKNGERVYKA